MQIISSKISDVVKIEEPDLVCVYIIHTISEYVDMKLGSDVKDKGTNSWKSKQAIS